MPRYSPTRDLLVVLTVLRLLTGTAAAQERAGGQLALADSLYFAGEPQAAWVLLQEHGVSGGREREARWRAIRAAVVLGMEPATAREQNQWLDRGVELSDSAKNPGPASMDELYWAAAVEGRRALNAGPRWAGELGRRAQEDALMVLAVDSLHGGAHNVLGKVNFEVMRLSRIERFVGRRVLGGGFPSDTSWEKAEYHLRRATELWPQMVLFHLDLGSMLARRGRRAEARSALEEALNTPSLHPPDEQLKDEVRALLADLGPPESPP